MRLRTVYAAKASTTGFSSTSTFPAITSLEYVGVGWNPGARIGIGSNLAHDGWDIYLNWTYFRSDEKDTSSVSPFEDLSILGVQSLSTPWLLNPSLYPAFDTIRAKWAFTLNQADLELGRRYWLSPCFNTRPYIAIRGAWTETVLKLHSGRTQGSFGDNIINAKAKDTLDNTFWGVGICAGIQPMWYFSPCFGLYGTVDFALLWGEYSFKHKAKSLQALADTGEVTSRFSVTSTSCFSQMQAIFDIGLGLRYENTYCKNRYRTSFDLGWEHHSWLDLNYRIQATSSSSGGLYSYFCTNHSIGFGGLVIRARLDF